MYPGNRVGKEYIYINNHISEGGKNMDRVRELVGAKEAYRRGIYGKNIGVAILDTGVYAAHPDLENRVSAFCDVLHHRMEPYDDCSHGTHVSSIIGGSGRMSGGRYMGIAPQCRLIHVKVLNEKGNGSKEDVIGGLSWVLDNKQRYGIRIVNISVGTVRESRQRDIQLVEAVEKVWDAGLIVVVAAGNMGPQPMSITVPGNSRKVITVGSYDRFGGYPASRGEDACYSGNGPTSECICKPDIVAPGSRITACSSLAGQRGHGFYCKKSGTSMATPVVSGAIALLLSKEPQLSNAEVKMRLRESCQDLHLPRNRQGWGRLDIGSLLFG